jgi:hypothetical protein
VLAYAANEYTTTSDREQFLALVKVTEKALQVLGHEIFEKTELLTLKVSRNWYFSSSSMMSSPACSRAAFLRTVLIRKMRRALADDQQEMIAEAIVHDPERRNWKIDQGPEPPGHSKIIDAGGLRPHPFFPLLAICIRHVHCYANESSGQLR